MMQDVDPAIAQVWARRAAELARVPATEDEGERAAMVVARIGREMYAFDARYVFDIRPAGSLARVPRVPAWVAGLTALRGRILSVFDLAAYFGLPPAEPGTGDAAGAGEKYLVLVETPAQSWAAQAGAAQAGTAQAGAVQAGAVQAGVARAEAMELCLLVDDVVAVAPLATSTLKDVGANLPGLPPEYVRGIALGSGDGQSPWGDGPLVVLDLPTLLADRRIVINQEVVQ